MKKTIELLEAARIEYERIRGHIYLSLPIAREGGTSYDRISFIYDTGAIITVLSRDTYEFFEFDKLPRTKRYLPGYAGTASGWVYRIPGISIGYRVITDVYAFSPEDYKLSQNLLADNVLEYFRIYHDNENDCLYFMDNPKPEPYVYEIKDANGKPTGEKFSLACTGVYVIDDQP
jgi:hypothetical protein